MISPDAKAMPLLKASLMPSSGSLIQQSRSRSWRRRMSSVPSVEAPSTTMVSMAG